MTTLWAQILIVSKSILLAGNAQHWFEIIATIHDIIAMACSLEQIGCLGKPFSETSGIWTPLCACPSCLTCPELHHPSWNLPATSPSVPFFAVHSISFSTFPRPWPWSQRSSCAYLTHIGICHQVLLASSLNPESLLPSLVPWPLWKVKALWSLSWMTAVVPSLFSPNLPPSTIWVAAAFILPLFEIFPWFLRTYANSLARPSSYRELLFLSHSLPYCHLF